MGTSRSWSSAPTTQLGTFAAGIRLVGASGVLQSRYVPGTQPTREEGSTALHHQAKTGDGRLSPEDSAAQ